MDLENQAMALAEFEEKQYETALLLELGIPTCPWLPPGLMFSAGQHFENFVAYDAATHPQIASDIWRLIGRPRPPGIVLSAGHFGFPPGLPSHRLPRSAVSLILQFKRPELRKRTTLKLHGSQKVMLDPHYCVKVARKWLRVRSNFTQHSALCDLEGQLAGPALVRYAAPAFSSAHELEDKQIARRVMAESVYVSPVLVGRRHTAFHYDRPGNIAYTNPQVAPVEIDNLSGLLRHFSAMEPTPFERQVAGIASAVREVLPRIYLTAIDWLRGTRIDAESRYLEDYIVARSGLAAINCNWILFGRRNSNQTQPNERIRSAWPARLVIGRTLLGMSGRPRSCGSVYRMLCRIGLWWSSIGWRCVCGGRVLLRRLGRAVVGLAVSYLVGRIVGC
ncbi:hypothetical protein [Pilimelia columellifera]|uniref:hypothetical protein n=1 Tax=Pilimelia columellifera TaxID=706574 RepID=UPI0031DF4544